MSYRGRAAIGFLRTALGDEDRAASSHWRHFHKDFELHDNGAITGLAGFGGCSKRYRGVRFFSHRVLQRRYRAMAMGFNSFGKLDRLALSITKKQERAYDLDVLRQTITLAFLSHHLAGLTRNSVVAVIGDGFASMTTLLLASEFAKCVILVNLNRTLLVDLLFFEKWASYEPISHDVNLVVDGEGAESFLNSERQQGVVAIQASNHALLSQFPIDLAINMVSMQEMDPPVIADYFADMRAVDTNTALPFYCCNREEKRLPDGTITRFTDYPWRDEDQVLIDELCPWNQQYYSVTPPFYRPYDGAVRHRLVRLA